MTSPASGPYQSRFVNFLLRQTRRVANECDRALRHAKVATLWGVQLLLSPAYWFLGGDRQNVQPLSGKPQPKRSLFSPPSDHDSGPSVDRPLEQVFQTLQETAPQTFQLPAAEPVNASSPWQKLTATIKQTIHQNIKTWFGSKPIVATPQQSPQPSSLTLKNPSHLTEIPPLDHCLQVKSGKITPVTHPVRGVATLLNKRELVLVTPNNEILDCLTLSQKQLLSQRIEAEITAYLQAVQIYLSSRQKWAKSLPSFLQKIPALPSLQRLQKRLPHSVIKPALAPADDAETVLLPTPIHPWLQSLDQALVKLENAPLKFPANVSFNLTSNSPGISAQVPANFSALGEQISHLPEQVKVLLQAAIQYFFGVKPQSPLQEAPTPQSLLGKTGFPSIFTQIPLADLPSAPPDLDDPWLTEEELFGQAIVQEVQEGSEYSSPEWTFPALPESQTLSWGKSFINFLKQKLQFSQHSPASTAIQKIISDVPPAEDWMAEPKIDPNLIANLNSSLVSQTSGKITANSSTSSSIDKPSRSSAKSSKSKSRQKKTIKIPTLSQTLPAPSESESTFPLRAQTATNFATHSPDWIETEARAMGYVKHPLESLLEWLDRVMFWLENLLVNILSFCKGLFAKS